MDKFFGEHKIFVNEPIYKFKNLSFWADFQLPVLDEIYLNEPFHNLEEMIRRELKDIDDKITP